MRGGQIFQEGASRSVLERLVGETGEPETVVKAARGLAERALAPMRAALAEAMSRPVAVELDDVSVARMALILERAGDEDAFVVAASAASPDAMALRLDPLALAVLVDAMFGADEASPPRPTGREPSALELDVAGFAFAAAATALDGTGARALQVRFPLPAATGTALARKTGMRDGPAVMMTYLLGNPPGAGRLAVVMPQRVVLKPRGGEPAGPAEGRGGEWSARFGEEVMRSTVKLEATIPLGKMTLGAIAGLQRGQVIELAEAAPAQTRLSARDKALFLCEFGRLGQNYTVRIKGPFGADEEPADGPAFP